MSELPYISILIPVYNVEPYMKKCIQSVMAQTYQGEIECIIVDDCGTDNSIAIAKRLIDGYNGPIEFRIIHHEHNRGLAAARNTAVAAAKGKFIIHVDSDDWIEPTMVDELVKKQQETDADIVSCNAIAHYPNSEVPLVEPDYASKDEMMSRIIKMTLDHVIWRRMIRAALYKDNNISAVEGVNIGEDHYTMPRLLFYAKMFAKCDKALYHYNCLTVSSYMQSSSTSFNFKRYQNDRDSIGILISFFSEHDPNYLDQLYSIKANFIYDKFFPALKMRNSNIYKQLCDDWQTVDDKYKLILKYRINLLTSSYILNVIRVYLRIFLKKTTGIKKYKL